MLVTLSLAVGFVGPLIEISFPSLVTDSLRRAQETHDAELAVSRYIASTVLALVGLVLSVVAAYGLLKFRHWAPRLALVTTALALIFWPISGAFVQSGMATAVSFLAFSLWGAVLVICLVHPYNNWFTKPTEQSEA